MATQGSIEIGQAAQADILRLAAGSQDGRETGGILLGRGPDADGVVHVEVAGAAGPRAERRSDFFLRDLNHARLLAEKAWKASRAVWVGEWHTHPRGGNRPSRADLSTYLRLLAASELQFELFVSIIVTAHAVHGWTKPQLWPWLLELHETPPSPS
jgi:integrative and conjugative element protein (TIGR02256 family)